MRPVYQTSFKGEVCGEETGNCLAACVASVLELRIEDVPNFAAIPGENDWWVALQDFVKEHGFIIYPIPPSLGCPEEAYWIAVGKSPSGDWNHCVVSYGTEIVHDPHPRGTGLDGFAKEIYLFVAQDPARCSTKREEAHA